MRKPASRPFRHIGGCYDVAIVKLPVYKGQEMYPLYVIIRIWALAYTIFAIFYPKRKEVQIFVSSLVSFLEGGSCQMGA